MKKRKWWDIRDGFIIGWFLTFFLVGFIQNPRGLGGFGAGLNAGFALQYLLNRKTKRLIEKHRLQDEIDMRTMADIVARIDYKALHQIEKAGLNILAIVVLSATLVGCSLPCTYNGKAVPRADADRMRSMGMDVTCP